MALDARHAPLTAALSCIVESVRRTRPSRCRQGPTQSMCRQTPKQLLQLHSCSCAACIAAAGEELLIGWQGERDVARVRRVRQAKPLHHAKPLQHGLTKHAACTGGPENLTAAERRQEAMVRPLPWPSRYQFSASHLEQAKSAHLLLPSSSS